VHPSIRLLVVGHSYVTKFAQAKYVAMKAIVPRLAVRLIVPTAVPHTLGVFQYQRADGLDEHEVVPLPPWLFHSHMTYGFSPLRVAAVLRAFQPQHVHIEEDPHSVIGVELATLARRICPAARVSFFTWDNLARRPMFPLGTVKRALTRYSFGRCDLVICGNVEAQQLLPGKGYDGPSVVLPQLGLDPEEYATPPDPETRNWVRGPSPETVVIGFVGRFVPEKGILELLQALDALAALPWRCVCIGAGPLADALRGEWKRKFEDRLLVVDPVPHERVAEFMKCLDIFVYYSQTMRYWKEQLGLSLVQAMLAGAACIGSSSGAIPDVIGNAGLIVPEKDVRALETALESLLRTPSQRESLGTRARQRALGRYTHRVVAEQYARAFWGDSYR
jgi:glycosyltransferase involved in cell wall biosynthesis